MRLRPRKGPLSTLSVREFDEFIRRLGLLLFRSVPAAAFARHKWPSNIVRDYLDVHPDVPAVESLALNYFKDVVGERLPTEELAMKWFGVEPIDLAAVISEYLGRVRSGRRA